jgi:hypothetical protein
LLFHPIAEATPVGIGGFLDHLDVMANDPADDLGQPSPSLPRL